MWFLRHDSFMDGRVIRNCWAEEKGYYFTYHYKPYFSKKNFHEITRWWSYGFGDIFENTDRRLFPLSICFIEVL